MPESHSERRRRFEQRLAHIRDTSPGWDIRRAAPVIRQIGWIAERPGERLHAVTLTELEALLADRGKDSR